VTRRSVRLVGALALALALFLSRGFYTPTAPASAAGPDCVTLAQQINDTIQGRLQAELDLIHLQSTEVDLKGQKADLEFQLRASKFHQAEIAQKIAAVNQALEQNRAAQRDDKTKIDFADQLIPQLKAAYAQLCIGTGPGGSGNGGGGPGG
jgi:hypothetical protein